MLIIHSYEDTFIRECNKYGISWDTVKSLAALRHQLRSLLGLNNLEYINYSEKKSYEAFYCSLVPAFSDYVQAIDILVGVTK